MNLKRLLTAAGITVATLALGLTCAPSANASGISYDNTDPVSTGCVSGAYAVSSWNFQDGSGKAELIYSPQCGTNWVNVYGYLGGKNYVAKIDGPRNTRVIAQISGVNSEHSRQIYAPGNTCVVVSWGHYVTDTGLVSGGTARIGAC